MRECYVTFSFATVLYYIFVSSRALLTSNLRGMIFRIRKSHVQNENRIISIVKFVTSNSLDI